MIKENDAGLKVISHILSLVRSELCEIDRKVLANKIDEAEYLLGLIVERKDTSDIFKTFLSDADLLEHFETYIKENDGNL